MFALSKNPDILEVQSLYQEGKASVEEVTTFFLNRSKQLDKHLNAILRYTQERAVEEAQKCDQLLLEYKQKFSQKNQNWFEELIKDYPLFGVPYALKDNILVQGEVASSSSKIIEDFKCPYSATVYLQLRQAGGVLIAQTNLDEWAMGSSTENSAFMTTKNPHDLDRVPGGSSGGSATVVASGQVVFALGTDTGGSVRQPAAFCGVVGVKPSYGLFSRYGVMPLANSLDQVGIFGKNTQDSLIITKVLAQKDPKDQTSIDSKEVVSSVRNVLSKLKNNLVYKSHLARSPETFKIGLPKEFFSKGLDPKIEKAIKDITLKLADRGHKLIEVDLPLSKYAIPLYYVVMTTEVAANLQRYDGVRYKSAKIEAQNYDKYRGQGFGKEAKLRILLGTYASSAKSEIKYYDLASKVISCMEQELDKAFSQVDLLLSPTTPSPAFKMGEKLTADPLEMYLQDVLTCGVNLVGLPGVAVPIGKAEYPKNLDKESQNPTKQSTQESDSSLQASSKDLGEQGQNTLSEPSQSEPAREASTQDQNTLLPIGCQIIGPKLSEAKMYSLALEIERLVK